jgi:hypothetical protein
MAGSGLYDIVCYGHNHEFSVARVGGTLAINPGPIMGARFPGGRWEDVLPTFVIVETGCGRVEAFGVHGAGGNARTVAPYAFEVREGWPG